MAEDDRLHHAFVLIDAAHSEDPRRQDGQPVELLYAQRMTDWLARLYPDAAEPLRLAARAQHIRRWTIPRSRYPMTRAGYLQWRTELGRFHAQTAGRLLAEAGYDAVTVERVGALIRKEQLKTDSDAQALEDVICMVFLQYEFADFAPRHEEAKVVRILRRTWGKMSGRGQAAALGLKLPPHLRSLIEKALAPRPGDPALP
jgi:hypothetical protein